LTTLKPRFGATRNKSAVVAGIIAFGSFGSEVGVVGIKEAEKDNGDEGDRDEVSFAFVGDEDDKGGDDGDAPGFAVGAVGGHAGDDALENVEIALDGGGFGGDGVAHLLTCFFCCCFYPALKVIVAIIINPVIGGIKI
jgi:hypothetical protein